MWDHKYLRRLKKDLPDWAERGWLAPDGENRIIAHVNARLAGGGHVFTYALSIFGVLLLGSGIISWFAANWDGMAKLVKLAVLLNSLWAAYIVAALLHRGDRHPVVGQAMVLLGVILFGANIFLIAQIYHIDSHFPNGVLMWAAGAVLTAYLLGSQPAMVAALLLVMLWNSMEAGHFENTNWPFLAVWALCLPAIHRGAWRPAMHLAIIALLVWSLFSVQTMLRFSDGDRLYLVQFYFLAYLSLFVGGMLLRTTRRFNQYAILVQRYSVVAVLSTFYMLTSPAFQSGSRRFREDLLREAAGAPWLLATLVALALVIGLAWWHRQRSGGAGRPTYLVYGQALIAATTLVILANLFLDSAFGSAIAIAFNLLYFAAMVWLVFAGLHAADRFLVNMAFVFFSIGLLTRYFDTFWTLLNRSFFFMAGGLVLIIGGYFLERQRRRLTDEIARRKGRNTE